MSIYYKTLKNDKPTHKKYLKSALKQTADSLNDSAPSALGSPHTNSYVLGI